ncbi:dihydrolipoamide acetyltransferase family protein [Ornithinimicrobium avium]|uniref:Dihydrolipoamide acetyltransferase component of pyruvate dehydrogenase complex n=1 Tax=Ornithinimicrobium avium TaxID=2283195 RepID=A0A345NN31_9MICO|nr:dihydrolipoamide acetyltransferase family protein [Ornithinimicrobium avium]AXH96439.1 2-oxo acid dehydrogenase subunit E2 [Ornithinimicrobium avium]
MSAPAKVFRLPDLGEGLTEAEVVQWQVRVGDEVGVDQEVVTVETAKAAVEVPCPYAGTVAQLHAEPGTVLAVGAPLITISDGTSPDAAGPANAADEGDRAGEQYRTEERAGARTPEGSAEDDAPERPLIGYGAGEGPARRRTGRRRGAGTPSTETPVEAQPRVPEEEPTQAVRVISPLVRRLAAEWGVDLASVRPGPTGVIRRADLEAFRRSAQTAPATAPSPLGEEIRIPIQGVQRIMVERLTTARREIPDATTWVDVDATRLMKTKDALRASRPEAGIGVLALLARIVVSGLTAYPALNSSVDLEAGEIVQHGRIHLGFAAQSPRGLVVPVVKDAGSMTTAELAGALRALTEKARDGKLTPAELSGGTFTLNNYGVFGVDGSTPIINHPEAAMLGVGRIVDKPWVHKGKLRVRRVTQLSLSFDHRVCDGGTAGGFLRQVADRVEQPAALLADL